MRIEAEKVDELVRTLDEAHAALMAGDDNGVNGRIAGRCAVLKVFLSTEREAQTLRVVHLMGDES